MPDDIGWRLLTRLITVDQARSEVTVHGARTLAGPAARAVAIMTTRV